MSFCPIGPLVLFALGSPAVAGEALQARLDAIAARSIAQGHSAGASVLVVRDGKVLLHKGYGFAELSLGVPAQAETVYKLVAVMAPFVGAAVLAEVDHKRLSLDDEMSKFIPEFPMQGHRVTVRQLLNNTSGIVDFHYIGDPHDGTSRLPRALDEVTDIMAGRPWVSEPGAQSSWSISNFHLLTVILERVTGQTFAQYLQRNLFAVAGVKSTTTCDDNTLVRGLARGYKKVGGEDFAPAEGTTMAFDPSFRFCSTVMDLFKMWRALKEGRLVRRETFEAMITGQGAGKTLDRKDPLRQYGFTMTINHEDGHRRIGQIGNLVGYSSALFDFPGENLTVVTLTNTIEGHGWRLARSLSREVLGLPPLAAEEPPPPVRTLIDKPPTPDERKRVCGTYLLKLSTFTPPRPPGAWAQYQRTVRIFDENGHLAFQARGDMPEPLLRQGDGSFAIHSAPRDRFTIETPGGAAAATLTREAPGHAIFSGPRTGAADVRTFHAGR